MSAVMLTPRAVQWFIGVAYLIAMTSALAAPSVSLDDFDRIYIQGNVQVELTPSKTPFVRASGDSMAVQHVHTEVVDAVLYIDAEHVRMPSQLSLQIGINELKEIVFDGQGLVVADQLESKALVLEGTGAGAFDLKNLRVEELVVVGKGRTAFRLSGQAKHQSIDLAGDGEYRGDQLKSRTSQVSVTGNGDVTLWADELLDVDVYGSAKVRYSGEAFVLRRIFGHGAVSKLPQVTATSL
jgi:hypothetical protein